MGVCIVWFSKEVRMVSKNMKKCLTSHRHEGGNANQKNIEILSHPSQNNYHQENKQQMLMRMLGKRYYYTLW
jgi:hypothetical protein